MGSSFPVSPHPEASAEDHHGIPHADQRGFETVARAAMTVVVWGTLLLGRRRPASAAPLRSVHPQDPPHATSLASPRVPGHAFAGVTRGRCFQAQIDVTSGRPCRLGSDALAPYRTVCPLPLAAAPHRRDSRRCNLASRCRRRTAIRMPLAAADHPIARPWLAWRCSRCPPPSRPCRRRCPYGPPCWRYATSWSR